MQARLDPLALECFGEEFFIVAIVVVRRIDEVDTEIDSPMKHIDISPLIGITELSLKRWTAITDGGYFQLLLAQIPMLHATMLLFLEQLLSLPVLQCKLQARIFLLIIRDSADACDFYRTRCVQRKSQRRSHDSQARSLDRGIDDMVSPLYTAHISHRTGVILPRQDGQIHCWRFGRRRL
jgi:hypothetical protein